MRQRVCSLSVFLVGRGVVLLNERDPASGLGQLKGRVEEEAYHNCYRDDDHRLDQNGKSAVSHHNRNSFQGGRGGVERVRVLIYERCECGHERGCGQEWLGASGSS